MNYVSKMDKDVNSLNTHFLRGIFIRCCLCGIFQSMGHGSISRSTCGTNRNKYCTSFILINNVAWSTNLCENVKSF